MPLRTDLWKIGSPPVELTPSKLQLEKDLREMIVSAPGLLSDEWMLIGKEVKTSSNKFIDLLAIAPDGSLVVIELKRDLTPREVVAQALDYASWVANLEAQEIRTIYEMFRPGKNLKDEFKKYHGSELVEDSLNETHQIVIVASELDAQSERIVSYLNERGISINVLFFQVFEHCSEQLISRTYLIDPAKQISGVVAQKGVNEPWNGEFYSSFGHGVSRSWEDAIEYGFICAGGGEWYSKTMKLLKTGDRVWVKVPGQGYVGVCEVLSEAEPANQFFVTTPTGKVPVLDAAKRARYHREFKDDLEKCEYFVAVKWIHTIPLSESIQEVGMFGNQNSVCKPTAPKWRSTVERLKKLFGVND